MKKKMVCSCKRTVQNIQKLTNNVFENMQAINKDMNYVK